MKNEPKSKPTITPSDLFVQRVLDATNEYFRYEHSQKIKRGLAVARERKNKEQKKDD